MIREIIFALIALLATFASVIFGADLYLQYQCSQYQEITGHETRYSRFDMCYVNTPDGWQRWDEYRLRAVASEGLLK